MRKKPISTTKNPLNTSLDISTTSFSSPMIAKPGVRLIAIVYDGMLILALLFLVGMMLIVVGTNLFTPIGTTSQEAQLLPVWYRNGIMVPAFIASLVGFYGLFWRRGGQTLGMQTWRLKTITNEGKLLNWTQSLVRILAACVVPVLCGLVGYVLHGSRTAILTSAFVGLIFNYIFCWFNQYGVAVHDMLSKTMTIKVPKIEHEGIIASFVRERRENKANKPN